MTPEEFVTLWQSSKNIQEVVEKSGSTESALYTRAQSFRKKGVKLKFFGGQGPKKTVNADELNQLIEKLDKENQ